jgi:uncharacterized cupin superfamily protein
VTVYRPGVRRVNLFAPELDHGRDRDGYSRRRADLGKQLGSARIGGSLYVLDEDERTWPYHFHHGMEEWAIVVGGAPTLRGPDGERVLRRGDVVCFPAGPEGAHQLRGPGSVLLLSANRTPETIEYPDSGKVACGPGKIFRAADAVDYWEGE